LRRRATGFAILCAALPAACARPLSDEECHALLERYVELLVQSDRPEVKADELVRMKLEARKIAAQDPAFSTCRSDVSRRAFECAMRAANADQLEQCLL
jgi:hypothetical protein